MFRWFCVTESAEKEKINDEIEKLKAINSQLQQEKELLEVQLNEVTFDLNSKLSSHLRKYYMSRYSIKILTLINTISDLLNIG